MLSRTKLLVILFCFIGDSDDKNPFKDLDVTAAAGSNLSGVRQTRYLIRIVAYCAQRAKVHY
jgi:hypothetical protein